MRRSKTALEPLGAVALAENAIRVLRTAPHRVIACYFVGALPFVIALLYFWTDMAYNAFAYSRVGPFSLLLAALFIWMKVWQSMFALGMRAHAAADPAPRVGLRRAARIACNQAIIHAMALLAMPIAVLTLAPFPWFYALVQNATVLDDGEREGVSALLKDSVSHANRWHWQNHILVWLMSPILVMLAAAFYLFLLPVLSIFSPSWSADLLPLYMFIVGLSVFILSPFGVLVAANIVSFLMFTPFMLRILLGIETQFSIGATSINDPTFMLIVCAMTYLCMDPVIKTAYVLRCYHADALHNGNDIRMNFKRFHAKLARAVGASVAVLLLTGFASAGAQSLDTRVSPDALDRALDQVLEQRDFAWRAPRVIPEREPNRIVTWFQESLTGAWDWVRDKFRRVYEWIEGWFNRTAERVVGNDSGSLSALGEGLRIALYLLIGGLGVALVLLLVKSWRSRMPFAPIAEMAATGTPDLEDESTTADALPEEGWLTMASELESQGDLRLAMRALFFATLAHLIHGGLIAIARYKSNRDYAIELDRFAHVDAQAPTSFRQAVGMFEAVWYGFHSVSESGYDAYRRVQETVRVRTAELVTGGDRAPAPASGAER